jgi:hypothetical protein
MSNDTRSLINLDIRGSPDSRLLGRLTTLAFPSFLFFEALWNWVRVALKTSHQVKREKEKMAKNSRGGTYGLFGQQKPLSLPRNHANTLKNGFWQNCTGPDVSDQQIEIQSKQNDLKRGLLALHPCEATYLACVFCS